MKDPYIQSTKCGLGFRIPKESGGVHFKSHLKLSECVINTDYLSFLSLSVMGAELCGHRPIRTQGHLVN